jgi:hypothetical protein
MPINNLIQLRKGTSSQWSSSNPVLASGEPGYDVTGKVLKIGDGITAWNSLSGISSSNGGGGSSNYDPANVDITGGSINGTSIGLSTAGTGNFSSLSITGIPVSISGHSHISSQITNFNSSVSGLVNGIYAPLSGATFSGPISSPTGIFPDLITNHINSSTDHGNINLVSTGSGNVTIGTDIDPIQAKLYVNTTLNDFPQAIRAVSNNNASGIFSLGINATSISSGIQSTNIALYGYADRGEKSNYGLYIHKGHAIFNNKIAIKDQTNDAFDLSYIPQASVDISGSLVAQSGSFTQNLKVNNVNVSVSGHTHTASNITDFNSSVSGLLPTINTDNQQPQGFINSTDSTISFNNTTRVFTIAPTGTNYGVYIKGLKYTKTTETITIPNTDGIYYIYFATSNGALSYKTTFFDFSTDVPIAYIYWNSSQAKAVFFAEERHGIKMDTSTHYYLHRVFGTQYISGLSIGNYVLAGDGSSNTHATFNISDGVIFDEDILMDITNSASPVNPFEQILSPTGQLPIFYRSGSNGTWYSTTANSYAVKTGTTVQYNLNTAGTWSIPDVNNKFVAMWIVATNNKDAPVLSIMGQRADTSFSSAKSDNTWGTLDLAGLPIIEFRPLYRLIFETSSAFTNTPKAVLSDILDLRSVINSIQTSTQNDHGSLYGLADDDHLQYVHIDTARTISANHTLTNGITFSGSGTQTSAYIPDNVNITNGSGNFNSLSVTGIPVSISGHTHMLYIGSGNNSIGIIHPSNGVLNIVGSGGTTIGYDNNTDTLTIGSSTTSSASGPVSTVGSDLFLWSNFR